MKRFAAIQGANFGEADLAKNPALKLSTIAADPAGFRKSSQPLIGRTSRLPINHHPEGHPMVRRAELAQLSIRALNSCCR